MTAKASRIPEAMRVRVMTRDGGCRLHTVPVLGVLEYVECGGPLQLDHVRASGALGRKSVTCDCNLVVLCAAHHRYKTEHGREVRPILLDYLSRFDYSEGEHEHAS